MTILWTVLTVAMAFMLGRSMLIWGFFAYAIGWPMMIVILLFGVKAKVWENRLASIQNLSDKIDNATKPKEYEDFNNVQDLFAQLEKK
jgi:hypothetical protein